MQRRVVCVEAEVPRGVGYVDRHGLVLDLPCWAAQRQVFMSSTPLIHSFNLNSLMIKSRERVRGENESESDGGGGGEV